MVVIQSAHPDLAGQWRQLHPKEAALLVGLPVNLLGKVPLRHLLPEIGQVASPLQAHWMALHAWHQIQLTISSLAIVHLNVRRIIAMTFRCLPCAYGEGIKHVGLCPSTIDSVNVQCI